MVDVRPIRFYLNYCNPITFHPLQPMRNVSSHAGKVPVLINANKQAAAIF